MTIVLAMAAGGDRRVIAKRDRALLLGFALAARRSEWLTAAGFADGPLFRRVGLLLMVLTYDPLAIALTAAASAVGSDAGTVRR